MSEKKIDANPATRAKNKYNSKNYDQFKISLPKGKKEEVDQVIKNLGYDSRCDFLLAAIEKMPPKQ